MLRGILVGLDGSVFSDAAVALSVRWAATCQAELVGLGIVDEPTIRKPSGLVVGGGHYKPIADERRLADARRRTESLLARFAAECAEAQVACRCLRQVGLPSEQILEEAQRLDLIVLGRQSYFQSDTREAPDETLQTILRHTPRPVVTVPRILPRGDSVVVAYDGSVQAARALQAFLPLRCGATPTVRIVSVSARPGGAQDHARRALDFLTLHGVPAELHPITSADKPAGVLLEKAAEWDAGLMVMGAYGKRTIRDFFFGSVTRGVLSEARIPLFLYH